MTPKALARVWMAVHFPADYATLNSADFLDKTTITNDRGIEIPYFGGQKFNRVLSEAAEDVSVGYQYLPFEVYARSDFKSTVGTGIPSGAAVSTPISSDRKPLRWA